MLIAEHFQIVDDQLVQIAHFQRKGRALYRPITTQICAPKDWRLALMATIHDFLNHVDSERCYYTLRERLFAKSIFRRQQLCSLLWDLSKSSIQAKEKHPIWEDIIFPGHVRDKYRSYWANNPKTQRSRIRANYVQECQPVSRIICGEDHERDWNGSMLL